MLSESAIAPRRQLLLSPERDKEQIHTYPRHLPSELPHPDRSPLPPLSPYGKQRVYYCESAKGDPEDCRRTDDTWYEITMLQVTINDGVG
jgi:hypothetical protein